MTVATAGESWTPDTVQVSKLRDQREVELVTRIHARVTSVIGASVEAAAPEAIRLTLAEQVPLALEQERLLLSRADRIRLQEAVFAETAGFGPIQDLLQDDSVTEIMVNGPRDVWIEREGRLYLTDVLFANDDHVVRVIQRIVAPLGRRIDESSPMVDARLPDGSRVNAIIPPLSLAGPVLTIRKFRQVVLSPEALVEKGAITREALDFLRSCVRARLNIVISGGTGTGKTTLLNILSSYISARERIITIEDAAELRLQQRHVIPLESRPPNAEGAGQVTIRELLRNALRMRPDRIVVGECRGGEALDMLQAMNTGHDGSMTTVHANGTRDALLRIETMALMAGADLPLPAIREQIAAAIEVVVQLDRMPDGSRKVTSIAEVGRLAGADIATRELFAGGTTGPLRPTYERPGFADKLEARGEHLAR